MTKAEMVWIDVETTGLEHDVDALLEVGIVLTDRWGNLVPRGDGTWLINEPADKPFIDNFFRTASADNFVFKMHTQSGLWADWMKGEGDSMAETEDDILQWLFGKVGGPANAKKLPMCGSSVGFDRNFTKANMPTLEDWFHYRSIDVSTIREIASLVNPRVVESAPTQMLKHRPYLDLIDSINLYKHFLDEFFFITDEDAPRAV